MTEELLTLKVTRRQLTLIRVACLMRLNQLKEGYNPLNAGDAEALAVIEAETRAMMDTGGCLHLPTVEEDNLPSR